MHLAHSLVPLALALHSVCCAAADKPEPKIPTDKSVSAAAAPAVGALGQLLSGLVPDIVRDIVSLFNEKEVQCKFVERLTAEVALRYRDLNVLVYATSPRSDDAGLAGSVCYSIDKPLAFWRNKEYRVCVLEAGRFAFAGEDKCENWGYRGCTTQAGGKTVAFCRRVPGAPESSSTTTTTAAQATTTTTTSRPSTTKRSTTSTKTSTGKPSTTSSRPKGTTASAEPTGGDPGAGATSTAAPPPLPPAAPPTSAGGNANTGAATTGGQPSAGSAVGPAMVGVLAAVMVAFVAGAL